MIIMLEDEASKWRWGMVNGCMVKCEARVK